MWAPFKSEEQRETITQIPQGNKSNKNSSLDDSQTSFTQRIGQTSIQEEKETQSVRAIILETPFKGVFANVEGDLPEFLQILDIGFEGLQQKEVNMICECDTQITVYKIIPIKLRKFTVFKIVEKFKFDKVNIYIIMFI